MIFAPNPRHGKVRKIHPTTMENHYRMLLERGHSNHSEQGLFLATFLNRLQQDKRAYTLHYAPGGGYFLELGTKILPDLFPREEKK